MSSEDRRAAQELEVRILAALGHAGLMSFPQLDRLFGHARSSRVLYRRVRRLLGRPNDGGLATGVTRLERMKASFACPVCGQREVVGVTRSWLPQYAQAEFSYQHAVGEGADPKARRCSHRLPWGEAQRVETEERREAAVAQKTSPGIAVTPYQPSGGRHTALVYSLTKDGYKRLADHLGPSRLAAGGFQASPAASSWKALEHGLACSDVYVEAVEAFGVQGAPWDLPVAWHMEAGPLPWKPRYYEKGHLVEGSQRYVNPDATVILPGRKRIWLEIETGTQALTDPNLENAGAVESKLGRYEDFTGTAPPGPGTSYYRLAHPDDSLGAELLFVATETRKAAMLRALGGRDSLVRGKNRHLFAQVLTPGEAAGYLVQQMGRARAEAPARSATARQRAAEGRAVDGVRLGSGEAQLLVDGVVEMRAMYERLRARVQAANLELKRLGGAQVPIESTPAVWTTGAKPVIERLALEVRSDGVPAGAPGARGRVDAAASGG